MESGLQYQISTSKTIRFTDCDKLFKQARENQKNTLANPT